MTETVVVTEETVVSDVAATFVSDAVSEEFSEDVRAVVEDTKSKRVVSDEINSVSVTLCVSAETVFAVVSLTGGSVVTEEDTLSPSQAEQSITVSSNAAIRFLRKQFIYLPPFIILSFQAQVSHRDVIFIRLCKFTLFTAAQDMGQEHACLAVEFVFVMGNMNSTEFEFIRAVKML